MINYYPNQQNPIWIDLVSPTPEEEQQVEKLLNIDVPTREEMAEIELSNRLYQENGATYTTIVVVAKATTNLPQTDALTMILTKNCLVSLRYVELSAFTQFEQRFSKNGFTSSLEVYSALLEAIINRTADILESTAANLDKISRKIFRDKAPKNSFRSILKDIGANGDLLSRIRDSLVTIGRAISFVSQVADTSKTQLEIIQKDISALSGHADSLSNKAIFMLDAVLGLISHDQNNIIKLFTVAALIFLPPTLIAGIYGMNFVHMPELEWKYGYGLAVVLMLLSAVLPLAYFKRKGWV